MDHNHIEDLLLKLNAISWQLKRIADAMEGRPPYQQEMSRPCEPGHFQKILKNIKK